MLAPTDMTRFGIYMRPGRYVVGFWMFHMCWLVLNDEGRLAIPESPSARTGVFRGLAEDGRILPFRHRRAYGARKRPMLGMGFGCTGDEGDRVHVH